jgi:hypothetical protein
VQSAATRPHAMRNALGDAGCRVQHAHCTAVLISRPAKVVAMQPSRSGMQVCADCQCRLAALQLHSQDSVLGLQTLLQHCLLSGQHWPLQHVPAVQQVGAWCQWQPSGTHAHASCLAVQGKRYAPCRAASSYHTATP